MALEKAFFLTHADWLNNRVTGGVQLCSREFFKVVECAGFDLKSYPVPYTRRWADRVALRLGVGVYNYFDVARDISALTDTIFREGRFWIFLNMATAVNYAKPLRERFGNQVKLILFSHGNISGDFLHLTTKPIDRYPLYKKLRDIVRLGALIHHEAFFRVRYLDAVVTVSETETQIENWFGATRTIYLPRVFSPRDVSNRPVEGRVGFVGRLDHPPNYQGLRLVLEEMGKRSAAGIEMRVVGAPTDWGTRIVGEFPWVRYLGELGDEALDAEVASWSAFLNPVFWYSTGVSTKLAWAIDRRLPVVSTPAGQRGYAWRDGDLPLCRDAAEMADAAIRIATDSFARNALLADIDRIRASGYSHEELGQQLREELSAL